MTHNKKFYISLGGRSGHTIPSNKKFFENRLKHFFETYDAGNVKLHKVDIRYSYKSYHAFISLSFATRPSLNKFVEMIDSSKNNHVIISPGWKIYNYIPKHERKLNTAFCQEDGDEPDNNENENVFDDEPRNEHLGPVSDGNDEGSNDEGSNDEGSNNENENVIGEEPDNEYDGTLSAGNNSDGSVDNNDPTNIENIETIPEDDEYESYQDMERIYTWLITPSTTIDDEINSAFRWLRRPYWEN
jgi:hypothetical protein